MSKHNKNNTILIVDDHQENIEVLAEILKDSYQIRFALSGKETLKQALSKTPPDLILLDIMMPIMDGFEVCRRLKADARTSNIPVIFVTALGEVSDEGQGFDIGCVDYLTKPVMPRIVKARVATHIALNHQNKILEEKVKERTRELILTRDATILGLAGLAETRDNETGAHIRRTELYVRLLATYLSKYTKYASVLTEDDVELLAKSAPLHDVGKVGIPDNILLKPGKLTNDEFTIMKTHVDIGRNALKKGELALGEENCSTFLTSAIEIAFTHHEKWNGTGYPRGLVGEQIPLAGRIMAVCDVYDALISRRVYKPPFTHVKAISILTNDSGKHFDPILIDAFINIQHDILDIAKQHIDDPDDLAILMDGYVNE